MSYWEPCTSLSVCDKPDPTLPLPDALNHVNQITMISSATTMTLFSLQISIMRASSSVSTTDQSDYEVNRG